MINRIRQSKLSVMLPGVGLIIVVFVLITGSCSHQIPAASERQNDRTAISIMHTYHWGKFDSPEILDYVENKLNIKLELIQATSSSYNNRARIAINKANGPDALVWTAFPQSELFNYARTGQLHQLDEQLAPYPNLMEIPSFIWDNSTIDGKLYGIPRPRAIVDQAVYIRKDWLDTLQLPAPITIDDYTKTAIRFANDDPDRNGKTDTFGFAASQNLGGVWEMSYAFDTGHIWKEAPDGTLVHSHLTEGRELALQWLKELYSSGGIDPQYNKWNTEQMLKRFISGRTGILISQISNFYHIHQELSSQNSDAELIMLPPPVGPTGVSGFAERLGFYGHIVIPSRVPAEKVDRILALLDWMSSEEGDHIRRYGLEGVHHVVQPDATLVVDAERMEKERIQNFFFMNSYDPYLYVTPQASPDIKRQQRDILDGVRSLGIPNPAATYMPAVQYRTGSVNSRDINEYFDNYVTGRVTADSMEQFRADWLEHGGRQATEEVNFWYQQQ